MDFNHDNFIASANYLDLDASLQWYIDTVGPKRAVLAELMEQKPAKMRALYDNDPVLQKLKKISDEFQDLWSRAL